jgi:NADPH:quinone reductase-like Zn-dependent oxidoreductase
LVAKALEEGRFRPVGIDQGKVWEFEDAKGAVERMMSRRARGKVVVKVQDL